MTTTVPRPALKGMKALVVGVANEHSIAYGCARSRSPTSSRSRTS